MGWQDEHLHGFAVGGENYGPEADQFTNTKSEQRVTLSNITGKQKRFVYTYDFGDSWEHEISIEGVVEDDGGPLPVCLDGDRACPPEDCGGVRGYQDLLEALRSPKKKASRERLEWVGEYDPKSFDPEAVNRRLLVLFGSDVRGRMRLRPLKEASRRASRPSRSSSKGR